MRIIPSARMVDHTLAYHHAVADHLRREEPALWSWFESDDFTGRYADETRLEILKSTYRLEEAAHGALYDLAGTVRERLGIEAPVTLYQSQVGEHAANASLVYLPSEVAIVTAGPVLERLEDTERMALLAHEMAHHALYRDHGGRLFTGARMLDWIASQPDAHPSFVETSRRLRLRTELHADAAALRVTGSRQAPIACLVKVTSGLAEVDTEAYLRQAREILERDAGGTREASHPEVYLRARALEAYEALEGEHYARQVSSLLFGPLDIDRADLLEQATLRRWTEALLSRVLATAGLDSEAVTGHARRFFPEIDAAPGTPDLSALRLGLVDARPSTVDYFAYVLLDCATADPSLGDRSLAAAIALAEEAGIASRFDRIARRELRRKKADMERLAQPTA